MGVDLGRVLFMDCETTGVDPETDRIVEIAFVEGEGGNVLFETRVNPGRSIPKEATEVHGISDADVSGLPDFSAHAETIQTLVERFTLATYNGVRFDSIILDHELTRAGQPGLPRDDHGRLFKTEIDVMRIWSRIEPRTLLGAAKRFGVDHVEEETLHGSQADARTTRDVLLAMLPLLHEDTTETDLVGLSFYEDAVDREGKFRRRQDGRVVFSFGKHKGQRVSAQKGYLEWMLDKDFSSDVKAWCRYFIGQMDLFTGGEG